MKKLMLLIGAIAMSVSFASAQRGDYGVNNGARGNHVRGGQQGHQHQAPAPRRGNVRGTTRNYGRNYAQPRYRGNRGRANVRGYNSSFRDQRRTRYVWSDCGTFQWQIVESRRWVPARTVWRNGCRRQVAGYWNWRQVSRDRYCAPRGRRGW